MNRCTACGYLLEHMGETLCFPCLLRSAIGSLSGHPAPLLKSQTETVGKTTKAKDPNSIAALPALSRPRQSPVKVKKQPQKPKTKEGRHDSTPRQIGGLVCILCGERVPKNGLLKHKADAHGELQVTPSPVRSKGSDVWVNVFQGGLPGLGKRR